MGRRFRLLWGGCALGGRWRGLPETALLRDGFFLIHGHEDDFDDLDYGNYERPLELVHALLDKQGLPVHYGWVDSWWYGERLHKGVDLWEDLTTNPPDFSDLKMRFPTGLTGMHQQTGRKVVAHIGEWRTTSPYEKNTSNGFVDRGTHTLPTSHSFWQELMGKAKDWGLLVMKQDHINENIAGYSDNITVKKIVGVNSISIKAIQKILEKPGLSRDKVAL